MAPPDSQHINLAGLRLEEDYLSSWGCPLLLVSGEVGLCEKTRSQPHSWISGKSWPLMVQFFVKSRSHPLASTSIRYSGVRSRSQGQWTTSEISGQLPSFSLLDTTV